MKNIKLFILKNCPFCIQALNWQKKIIEENPQYQTIDIEIIDEGEQYELANSYDYYYVPTYFVEGEKLHEGVATIKKIDAVLKAAL